MSLTFLSTDATPDEERQAHARSERSRRGAATRARRREQERAREVAAKFAKLNEAIRRAEREEERAQARFDRARGSDQIRGRGNELVAATNRLRGLLADKRRMEGGR
jgi:hypothetical protein